MNWRLLVLPCALTLVLSAVAVSQERGGRPEWRDRAERGEGQRVEGQRGGWDPQQVRERMAEGMKRQLQVDDEEWQVLQPKIERVLGAQRGARGGPVAGMMGGRGGEMGGRGGRGGDGEGGEVTRASRELRTVLQNEDASAQEIADRLAAYRAAREQAAAELEAARAELKELLTQRQEAVLVMAGVLE